MTLEELTKIYFALKTTFDEKTALALYTKLVKNVKIDDNELRTPELSSFQLNKAMHN